MTKAYFLLFAFLCPFGAYKLSAQQKQLLYENKTYEPGIRTVQLIPEGNGISDRFAPSVKNLADRSKLVLEFDDLAQDADYYFVRFIHCNADWSPSDLRPGMFLQGFNEFEIEDFEFSSESKINYVHYRFELPNFKKGGNYLAVVYRDRKKEDFILTRQFMVHQNTSLVGGRVMRSSTVNTRLTHQRVEVTVNYTGIQSNDPRREFKVIIRQNQRPDQTRVLPVTYLDQAQSMLKYQNLGADNEFFGGNEFRFFDLSTTNSAGRNIERIDFEGNRPVAHIMKETRRREGYFQNLDINGQFYIRDLEGGYGRITAEYVQTHFSLEVPEKRAGIYVLGAFNNWQADEKSRMDYDSQSGQYQLQLLIKQGWYDYMYWSSDPLDEQEIERSFFDTENLYEIFVYHRAMGSRGDELVGYGKIDFNNRRR